MAGRIKSCHLWASATPTEEAWVLDTSCAVKIPERRKNWSAHGPDRLLNFSWKRAHVLHEGVVSSYLWLWGRLFPPVFWREDIADSEAQRIFTSDNQCPISCLNTMYICFTSFLLVPTGQHLDEYNLMEGARTGCTGTVGNLLIDWTMTLDRHSSMGNLGMAWIDVKKAYDSVDHGCLNKVMLLHRFPVWLCRVIAKLFRSGNTRLMVVTRKGRETSEPIIFNRGSSH